MYPSIDLFCTSCQLAQHAQVVARDELLLSQRRRQLFWEKNPFLENSTCQQKGKFFMVIYRNGVLNSLQLSRDVGLHLLLDPFEHASQTQQKSTEIDYGFKRNLFELLKNKLQNPRILKHHRIFIAPYTTLTFYQRI